MRLAIPSDQKIVAALDLPVLGPGLTVPARGPGAEFPDRDRALFVTYENMTQRKSPAGLSETKKYGNYFMPW
jgi:hypothetical protein